MLPDLNLKPGLISEVATTDCKDFSAFFIYFLVIGK